MKWLRPYKLTAVVVLVIGTIVGAPLYVLHKAEQETEQRIDDATLDNEELCRIMPELEPC